MNIAEILKDAPIGAYTNGIKLYSPMFGNVELMNIFEDGQIEVSEKDGTIWRFKSDGCIPYGGEIMLFPSKENRDWSTFKVEPEFPTTYKKCNLFLNRDEIKELNNKIETLRCLVACRNVWWKVDNDWKPDWEDEMTPKYDIICSRNRIEGYDRRGTSTILAFRTREIRDKFLETFRDLIEECKELI